MSSENVPVHLAVVFAVALIGPEGLRVTDSGAFMPAQVSCTYSCVGSADADGVTTTITGLGVLAGAGRGVVRGAGAVVGLGVTAATGWIVGAPLGRAVGLAVGVGAGVVGVAGLRSSAGLTCTARV